MGQGQQDRAPAAPGTGAPMSFEQAAAHLVGTDPRFALTEAAVRGQRQENPRVENSASTFQ